MTQVISVFSLVTRFQTFPLLFSFFFLHVHTAIELQELNGFRAEIMRLIRKNADLTAPQGEEDLKDTTDDDKEASETSDKVSA